MAGPLIEFAGVSQRFGGLRPLRIRQFTARATDRIVLSGFDQASAEVFIHLISGAAVPEEGAVVVDGADTRTIATDTEWLASLDRFGIVTQRAVFIESLPVAANLALPLTLAIDPLEPAMRSQVADLARLVGLDETRLDVPISTLTPAERLHVHLARAFAPEPRLVLLEHPTVGLERPQERAAFGRALLQAADARAAGFVAVSEDADFAVATGAQRMTLNPATGEISRVTGGWWPWR